ncbi:hypothetical protein BGLA2_2290001 [Burkholderia gladioli]|nr:hypothetical protein BGLA2_2290001 [Burkholderia gladioli]
MVLHPLVENSLVPLPLKINEYALAEIDDDNPTKARAIFKTAKTTVVEAPFALTAPSSETTTKQPRHLLQTTL